MCLKDEQNVLVSDKEDTCDAGWLRYVTQLILTSQVNLTYSQTHYAQTDFFPSIHYDSAFS